MDPWGFDIPKNDGSHRALNPQIIGTIAAQTTVRLNCWLRT
jgi:hypothetical protein